MTSQQPTSKRYRRIILWSSLVILVIAAGFLLVTIYGGSSEHPIYTLVLKNTHSTTLSIYTKYPAGSEYYVGDIDPGKEIIVMFDTHSVYIDVIGKDSDGEVVFSERCSYYSEDGPLQKIDNVYRIEIPEETHTVD